MKPILIFCRGTVLIALLASLSVSCQPSNPLIGRWQEPNDATSGWIEFNQDGSMTTFKRDEYPEGFTYTMPYSYTSNTIILEGGESFKYRFVNKDLVVFTLGDDITYERVKVK